MKIRIYKHGARWWAVVTAAGTVTRAGATMCEHHETWAGAMRWAIWAARILVEEAQVGS